MFEKLRENEQVGMYIKLILILKKINRKTYICLVNNIKDRNTLELKTYQIALGIITS